MIFKCFLNIENFCNDCKILPKKYMFYKWLWRVFIFFNIKKWVNIILVNKKEILDLNIKFRNKNYVTDILSFPILNPLNNIFINFLGDIFICPLKILSLSLNNNINYCYYFTYLSIHGLLHILGFKHNNLIEYKNMRVMELFFLSKLKNDLFF